jgi:diguanylate cyclase (GGDEF)-like protein
MKNYLISICFWLLLISFPAPSFANHGVIEGVPLIKRYLPQDYLSSSGNATIATDKLGRIYVGNSEGIMRFDGTQWELIEIPGRSDVRDLLSAQDGKLYVAGYDTFGVMNPDKNGELTYQELLSLSKFDSSKHSVGIVWLMIETKEGIYFQAEDFLFFVSFDRKTVHHWPLDADVRTFFSHQNQLYARIAGKGFSKFVDGKFVLEKDGALFKDQAIAALIDRGNWRLLVTDIGFFRSDANGIQIIANSNAAALKGLEAYEAVGLPDEGLAVGTRSGEVLRFDAKLHLVQQVKVGNYLVTAMHSDLEGGLWVVTEGDIVRLATPSPWSYYDESIGITGTIYDFEWYRNALWTVGSTGVSRITHGGEKGPQTTKITWLPNETYAIESSEDDLILAHRQGLLVIDRGQTATRTLETPEDEAVTYLLRALDNPDLMYAISDHHLLVLSKRPGRWQLLRQYSFEQMDVVGIVESKPGELWIGNGRGQVERWLLDSNTLDIMAKQRFGSNEGLPLANKGIQRIYRFQGQVHVVVSDKDYVFNGNKFVASNAAPFNLVTRPYELNVLENDMGAYAYTSREIWHKAKDSQQWKILRSGLSNSAGYNNLKLNHDGVLRMATWGGVLQYMPHAEKMIEKKQSLNFAYVDAISPDGKITALPVNTKSKIADVPAGHNMKLRFQMVDLESGVDYRYRLNQISKEWSAWSDRDLFIRALPPGTYNFELQAKTRSGQIADTVAYRFNVMPYWYERIWVRVVAALLLIGLIGLITYAVIRMRTARYLNANIRLEEKISERTQELEIANQRLSELATEDALTGVANRRALEQGLQREWYRCLDLRVCLSAMMIDVDHFKKYNDKHGHLEGDKLLRELAQSLQFEHDTQRELFARFGGEEFALLLPGVSFEEAVRRAELIRSKVSKFPNNITVSIGVAGFVPTVHLEKNSLLRRADAALYRAKRLGRNRVEADND